METDCLVFQQGGTQFGKRQFMGSWGLGERAKAAGKWEGNRTGGVFWGIRASRGPHDVDTRRVWRDGRAALSMQTLWTGRNTCIYLPFFPSLLSAEVRWERWYSGVSAKFLIALVSTEDLDYCWSLKHIQKFCVCVCTSLTLEMLFVVHPGRG